MSRALLAALCASDPAAKCAQVAALRATDVLHAAPLRTQDLEAIPGRPARPVRVQPSAVPRRGLGSAAGRAALIHAVAHIEFNAINLALDAALRFRGMPDAFYADWLSVAQDEARHFLMLSMRLSELGHAYGDFTAHDGLWEAAEKTAHDVLVRMALVPRVLEARGLDVTPGMIGRLREVGDAATAGILELILSEEIRHVSLGTHWFHYLCSQRGMAPAATFAALLHEHRMRLHPPFNLEARVQAGFEPAELQLCAAASAGR